MEPDQPKGSRVEPIFYVGIIITCGLVILFLVTGYAQCGSSTVTGLIYLTIFTLGAIIWVPALFFGLLIHATSRRGFKNLARVAMAFVMFAFAVWVIEAQVYPNAEKTSNRCSL